jgi:hypothetical protein
MKRKKNTRGKGKNKKAKPNVEEHVVSHTVDREEDEEEILIENNRNNNENYNLRNHKIPNYRNLADQNTEIIPDDCSSYSNNSLNISIIPLENNSSFNSIQEFTQPNFLTQATGSLTLSTEGGPLTQSTGSSLTQSTEGGHLIQSTSSLTNSTEGGPLTQSTGGSLTQSTEGGHLIQSTTEGGHLIQSTTEGGPLTQSTGGSLTISTEDVPLDHSTEDSLIQSTQHNNLQNNFNGSPLLNDEGNQLFNIVSQENDENDENESKREVFKYIERIDDEHVQCNKCKKKLKFQKDCTNTGNLWKHKCLIQLKEIDEKKFSNYYNQQYLNYSLLKIIVEDQRTFNLFSTESFKNFFHIFLKDFKIPVYNTIIALLEKNYKSCILKMKNEFEKIEFYSFSSDLWTSLSKDHYLATKIVYIDDNWKIQSKVISFLELIDVHVDNIIITNLINNIFEALGIKKEKITSFTCDKGSNIRKAIENLNIDFFHCTNHNLNLCITDSLDSINLIRDKIKKIISTINHSNVAIQYLRELQKIDIFNDCNYLLGLVNDTETRWSSTFNMFKRLIELKKYINNVLNTIKKYDLLITITEWESIEQIIKILKLPSDANDILGGENYITSSYVIPVIIELIKDINDIIINNDIAINFKNILLNSLKERFEETLDNDNLLICSFLNPLTKELLFIDENKKNFIIEKINIEISDYEISNENNNIIINSNNLKVLKFLKINTENNNISDEVNKYINSSVNQNIDILDYWKNNQYVYPKLAKLAKKYLIIYGSSTPVERTNSEAGRIVTKLRNSLTPNHVEQLIILNSNYDKW